MWSHPASAKMQEKKVVCTRCRATRTVPCEFCGGRGETVVGRDSRGMPKYSRCGSCFGRKVQRCRSCHGEGFV